MLKYIFFVVLFLFQYQLSSQEIIDDAPISSQEVDLESEFIIAMQDVVLEKYDDAIEKLKNLTKKTQGEGITEFHIARIYLKQNKLEDALFQAKKAVQKNPSNIYFKELLIEICEKTKDYKTAADIMAGIIGFHKFDRKEYFDLAELYSKAEETEKALQILEDLQKTAGFDLQTEFYKVSLLLKAKNYEKAEKILLRLDKEIPENVEILQKLSTIYRLINDPKKTVATFKRILKIDPQNPQALSYLSTQKGINQNEKNFISDLEPFLRNPGVNVDEKILTLAPYVENVSRDHPLLNDLINAAEILIDQYPHNARTNALYADLLYNAGQTDESIKYYIESLEYEKSNFMIWKQLMLIYTMNEDWENLLKLCTEAIDYYPNQSVTFYYAGRASVNLNMTKQAHEYLDEAILLSQEKEKFKNEILLMKAKAFILEKKSSKATEVLDNIDESLKANHPFYFELRGDIKMLDGDIDKAMEYWKKSLETGNNSKRLSDKLKNQ